MTNPSTDPFFILGSPRSGTTMLRDLLRSVPGLHCPEETHFYRWGQPYRVPQFKRHYLKNKVLAKHREIDGISDDQVEELFATCRSRREFFDGYMALFLAAKGAPGNARWFDKTPQNIYGVTLLGHDFPNSRFVHIYRNPLNVVASLRVGKVMSLDDQVAASNYWSEAVVLAESFRKANPDRMISVAYEDLTRRPVTEVDAICEFVGIETPAPAELAGVKPEANRFTSVLEPDEIALVKTIVGDVVDEFGYRFEQY